MGLSQRDQSKHNTLLRLGTQSVKRGKITVKLKSNLGENEENLK